jgi:hypothetical protein
VFRKKSGICLRRRHCKIRNKMVLLLPSFERGGQSGRWKCVSGIDTQKGSRFGCFHEGGNNTELGRTQCKRFTDQRKGFRVRSYTSCSCAFVRKKYTECRYCTCTHTHHVASRKVAGSSPDEVDFLNWPNPSGRIVSLGSTQPLTEMNTRNL